MQRREGGQARGPAGAKTDTLELSSADGKSHEVLVDALDFLSHHILLSIKWGTISASKKGLQ